MKAKTAEHKEQPGTPLGMRDVRQQRCYLANILPLAWTRDLGYRLYHIPACRPDEPFALTEISSAEVTMDFGDKRKVTDTVLARDVAEDLARMINSDAGEDSFLGVFLCGPEGPDDEALLAANRRVDEFAMRCIARADRDFARPNGGMFITDLDRMMCARMNLEREWSQRAVAMELCPGCGEHVRTGVAKCKTCGAILDREKAAALGLLPPPPAAPAAR